MGLQKSDWWANSPENIRIALFSTSYLEQITTENAVTSIGLPRQCLTVLFSFRELIQKAKLNGNFQLVLIDINQCTKEEPAE